MWKSVLVLGALATSLSACVGNDTPSVEITSPASAAVIDHLDPIPIAVTVFDDELADVTLEVDGAPVTAELDPPFAFNGDCSGGCRASIIWTAVEATEGAHVLTVVAEDVHGLRAEATVNLELADTPSVTLLNPDSSDQLGVGVINVAATFTDRSALTAELRVDGVVVPATLTGECRAGCMVTYAWDTTGLDGTHDLDLSATDPFGRVATTATTVELGDIPYASSIEITGESDGFGALEVEVHLFDADTNEFLGCSGQSSGLEGVDSSNVRYDVVAWFIDASSAMVPASALAGRNVRVEVTEDDNFPCPGSNLGEDDLVGISAPVPASDLATLAPLAFGRVVYLALSAGRPFER